MNYYRRPLPSTCVSFSSDEGKLLFKEAMMGGNMENYFRVASQLRTQDEPAFCGLASLVMCLNALEVDPGRIWKAPWRWYHEQMLDCCIPLDFIKERGITIEQFVCIAKCNGLKTELNQMSEKSCFEEFRNLLLRICKKDDEIVVVSYSRKLMGQTGDGHFAPIGGFNENKEMVLLFDTARFKYPPHWVPAKRLWESMFAIDFETGEPRGYMLLSKDESSYCLLLLSTSVHLNEHLLTRKRDDTFSVLMHRWEQWLDHPLINVDEKNTLCVVTEAVQHMLADHLSVLDDGANVLFPLTCHNIFSQGMNEELESTMSAIIKQIVESKIGLEVSIAIDRLSPYKLTLLSENVFLLPKMQGCTLLMLQDTRMKLTFLITSWLLTSVPIHHRRSRVAPALTRSEILHQLALSTIDNELSPQSQIELTQLTKKLTKMHTCCDQPADNKNMCCEE